MSWEDEIRAKKTQAVDTDKANRQNAANIVNNKARVLKEFFNKLIARNNTLPEDIKLKSGKTDGGGMFIGGERICLIMENSNPINPCIAVGWLKNEKATLRRDICYMSIYVGEGQGTYTQVKYAPQYDDQRAYKKIYLNDEHIEVILRNMCEINHTGGDGKYDLYKGLYNKCFIATAVYGSYDAAEVEILRKFRDTRLLHSTMGKQFVKGYYYLSPTIASWISDKKILKIFLRYFFFKPLIRLLTKFKKEE